MKIHETVFVVASVKAITDDCTVVTLGQSWERRSKKNGNETQWLNARWYINNTKEDPDAARDALDVIKKGMQIKMPDQTVLVPDNFKYTDKDSGEEHTFHSLKVRPPERNDDISTHVEIIQNGTNARGGQNLPF